jgi:hypothetical protein
MPDKNVGIPYKTNSNGVINSGLLNDAQIKIVSIKHIKKAIHTNPLMSLV